VGKYPRSVDDPVVNEASTERVTDAEPWGTVLSQFNLRFSAPGGKWWRDHVRWKSRTRLWQGID